jgi:hypothetical protein
MAKKLAKKEMGGGPTKKTVTKSPSGNYKTIVKVYDNDNTTGVTSTVRRTVKGVINKALKVPSTKVNRSLRYNDELKNGPHVAKDKDSEESRERYKNYVEGDYKKGGVVKSKSKIKTKK